MIDNNIYGFNDWVSLNEQSKFKSLGKIFTKEATEKMVKKFDETGLKQLDDLFGQIFRSEKNFVKRGDEYFIKSASDSQVSFNDIDKGMKKLADGNHSVDDFLTWIPREAADGTPIRAIVKDSVPIYKKSIGGSVAKVTDKELISRLPHGKDGVEVAKGWQKFGGNAWPQSGWKIHVLGETLEDSVFLYEKLEKTVNKWGAHAKVGGTYHATADLFKKGQYQYGKSGATIYVPVDVIKNGRQVEFLNDITDAIKGYKKSGKIKGDKLIDGPLNYRYDFKGAVPKSGITDMQAYDAMYKKNDGTGPYKPDDVSDLFKQ